MSTDGETMLPALAGHTFALHAVFLADRLEVGGLGPELARHPRVVSLGERGWAVLFRYGAVVTVDATAEERAELLDRLRQSALNPFAEPETEEATLSVDPGGTDHVESDAIVVRGADVMRVQVVADVLAKSVAMAHYEEEVAGAFDRFEPMAGELRRTGKGGRRARELLKDIGQALLVQHRMVGRVEVLEKPELLWEHPELERLYARLREEYELRERHAALASKVELISDTARVLLEVLQTNRSLRVEWYIVALILIEILITLYAMGTGIY